jgi:hypothetical protein
VICLPEIDAGRTDANLLGNFGNRQAAPGSSIAEIASETWLARHDLILQLALGRCNIVEPSGYYKRAKLKLALIRLLERDSKALSRQIDTNTGRPKLDVA